MENAIVNHGKSGRKSIDNKGQGMVEFAFILFLVAVAVVAMLGLFGDSLASLYTKIVQNLPF